MSVIDIRLAVNEQKFAYGKLYCGYNFYCTLFYNRSTICSEMRVPMVLLSALLTISLLKHLKITVAP
jgi:hypothetical protein